MRQERRPRLRTSIGLAAMVFGMMASCAEAPSVQEPESPLVEGSATSRGSWSRITAADGPFSTRRGQTMLWTGTEMIVWGGGLVSDGLPREPRGARYNPTSDTWQTIPADGCTPPGYVYHTAVWTGTEMIVWGGTTAARDLSNQGGAYDPATDEWRCLTGAGAPQPRTRHAAVWTGTEMIVWGGSDGDDTYRPGGGRYNPISDTWRPVALEDSPPDPGHEALDWIFGPVQPAVWTGAHMLLWGGEAGGARYDPAADRWEPITAAEAPSARAVHTMVWTGTEMIVWGGWDGSDTASGGRYDPDTDTWTDTATLGAPDPRHGHLAVWTDGEMLIWGGREYRKSGPFPLNSGGLYDPISDSWSSTPGTPRVGTVEPQRGILPRGQVLAVWTGDLALIWPITCVSYGHAGGVSCPEAAQTGGARSFGLRFNPTGTAPDPTTTTTTTTTTMVTSTTVTNPPVTDLESGLFCRDLASLGYDYAAAVAYWSGEGNPDRMDADRNGIPCETIYSAEEVLSYWGDPLPTTTIPDPGGTTVDRAVAWVQNWLDERFDASEPPPHVRGAGTLECDDPGPTAVGDVVGCLLTGDTDPGFPMEEPGVVIYILDESGRSAWSTGTDVPDSTASLRRAYAAVPHGLTCQDLLSPDARVYPFDAHGRPPASGFFWSMVYWSLEGNPDRMDADRNGIPCETRYDADVVAEVLEGGPA